MDLYKKRRRQNAFALVNNENAKTLHKYLEFTATEQYKLIRANLDFTFPEGEKCPVIGVTSSMKGEGKSTTSINLSYVFAETGSKVLLIDADLRLPTLAKKMDIENSPGLADLLRGNGIQLSQIKSHLLSNWFILPAGDIPPNPSELLGSSRMKNLLNQLREIFDYIIIDLPPVNIVSDAISISRLITGMIVVIREEHTEKRELERCFRQLKLSNVNILGCVMNQAKVDGGSSYKQHHKYAYYKRSVAALEENAK